MKKIILSVFALSGVLHYSQAQLIPVGPQSQWNQITNPTASVDLGIDVDRLSDGNFIHLGTTKVSSTNNNLEIKKNDPDGNTLWQINYGGGSDEYVGQIKATSDGGFVVCGRTSSYGSGGGNSDIMLLKYNTSGTLLWQKFYGVSGQSETGNTVAPINGGAGGFRIGGSGIITTDASGNQLSWIFPSGFSQVNSITNTSDGGYAAVNDGSTGKITKFNSSNTVLWSTNFNAQYATSTTPQSIQETPNGDLVVVGWDFDGAWSVWGGFLVRTNSTGTISVNRTYYTGAWHSMCEPSGMLLYDFVQDGAGNFILTGSAETGGCTTTGGIPLLMKVNSAGNISEPYYSGTIAYPGTWMAWDTGTPGYYGTFEGIVAASECGDGFVVAGYDKLPSAGSSDYRSYHRKFYDTDYNWVSGNSAYYTATRMDINTNTTWTGAATVKRIAGNLVVKSPNTLTISAGAVLEMGLCGKIIVERGAHLIVNNAKITSLQGYATSMWKGIDVWGTKTASQSTAGAQGKVTIQNNAIIENALDAINTIKDINDIGNWDWNYTGGIIKVTDSKFLNNRRSVQYLFYQNFHPTTLALMNNQGNFKNVTFETNAQIRRPGVLPNVHVSMYEVTGIFFSGSKFRNVAPAAANGGTKGNGITSADARYTVTSYCSSAFLPCPAGSIVRSKFENLTNGIYATSGTTNLRGVTVTNTDFTNITNGVYTKMSNTSSITNSTFDVNSGLLNYGIQFDGTQSFKCEGNAFTSTTGGLNIGVIVNNMLTSASSVYRNTFSALRVGTWAINDNYDGATGLKINCDRYLSTPTPNAYDVAVTGGTINTDIDPWQGTCTSDALTMVRNTYSAVCIAGQENQYFVDKLTTTPILHANHAAGLPVCADAIVLNWLCTTPPSMNCPSTLGGGKYEMMKMMTTNTGLYEKAAVSVAEKIKAGSDPSLVKFIDAETSSAKIKDAMLALSPYLSDDVLIALIKKSGLNRAHLKDILVANSPLSEAVIKSLDGVKLANGHAKEINTAQEQISPRVSDEGLVHFYKSESLMNYADVVREYLTDTIIDDTLIDIIKQQSLINNDKLLLDFYLEQGNFQRAAEMLKILSADPNNKDLVQYKTMILDLMKSEQGMVSLFNNEKYRVLLEGVAKNSSNDYSKSAESLLSFYFGQVFESNLSFPKAMGDMVISKSLLLDESGSDEFVKVYPNPAKDFLVVEYDMLNDAERSVIKITNILGHEVLTQELIGSNGKVQINTEKLEEGVYFYSHEANGKVISTAKVVIVK